MPLSLVHLLSHLTTGKHPHPHLTAGHHTSQPIPKHSTTSTLSDPPLHAPPFFTPPHSCVKLRRSLFIYLLTSPPENTLTPPHRGSPYFTAYTKILQDIFSFRSTTTRANSFHPSTTMGSRRYPVPEKLQGRVTKFFGCVHAFPSSNTCYVDFQVEEVNMKVTELAKVSAKERALIRICKDFLSVLSALKIDENNDIIEDREVDEHKYT